MTDTKPKLLLDSVYISSGGGLLLLNYLINELKAYDVDVHYLMDKRNKSNYSFINSDKITIIKPSALTRHQFYVKNKDAFDIVFTFNNIPPTIKMSNCTVYTYFHQALYLNNKDMGLRLRDRALYLFKKSFISFFIKNSDYFFVQTQTVRNKFSQVFKVDPDKILVMPFFEEPIKINALNKVKFALQYVFVSDGHQYKNHERLLKAWEIVNSYYPAARLTMTVSHDRFPELCKRIEEMKTNGLNVINIGFQDQDQVLKLYDQHKFLVYPSLAESFGLGLIEAVNSGCEIIASDLDYVKSTVQPMILFNPRDPKSIAEKIVESIESPNEQIVSKLLVKNHIRELLQAITNRT